MGAIRRPLPNRQRRRMSIEVMVWLRIEKGVLSYDPEKAGPAKLR
jgi:hypothetical protein